MLRTVFLLLITFALSHWEVQESVAAELKAADVANAKGDGNDGKGNSDDDTWQFWFELAHKKNSYRPLTLATSTMSEQQKAKGIPRKVTGPVAAMLPGKETIEGWILHTDWDGRFEGAWGDTKSGDVFLYPYVEKGFHGAVAVTYRVPESGKYDISAKVSDAQVAPKFKQHDGFHWRVEIASGGSPGKVVGKGGPIGDGRGRPDSGDVMIENVEVKKGQHVRLVIDPIGWWGSDLTRIEGLKIEPAGR